MRLILTVLLTGLLIIVGPVKANKFPWSIQNPNTSISPKEPNQGWLSINEKRCFGENHIRSNAI